MLFASALAFGTFVLGVPVEAPKRVVITPDNVHDLRPISTHRKSVTRIEPGPKPGELAFVGWETPVEIVDDMKFEVKRIIAEKRKVLYFAASPTGKHVAWTENGSSVVVEETATGKSMTLENIQNHPKPAFSPNGQLIATGGYARNLKVWDLQGKLVHKFPAGGDGGLWPVFSPDGALLAIGNRNHETYIYELATGKLKHQLPRKMTQEIAFSPDSKTLAAGYVDGAIVLWDTATGEAREASPGGASEIYSVAWSPKGDLLATSGLAGKIIIWNPKSLKPLKQMDAPSWVIQVCFTPDGTRLLTSGAAEGTGKTDRKVTVFAVERK